MRESIDSLIYWEKSMQDLDLNVLTKNGYKFKP